MKMRKYYLLLSNIWTVVLGASYIGPFNYDLDFSNFKSKSGEKVADNTVTIGNCKLAIDRSCPDQDINFFHYSRDNPYRGEQVYIGNDFSEFDLFNVNFDPGLPTKIIIHGYNSDKSLPVLNEIKDQYFRRNSLNVFMVDWSPLAEGPCYPAAVWNSRHVGKCTSKLIKALMETGARDIHLIGFSLGAHVAAFASNNIKPYKIPRITGLDPAMPGFITVSDENKLNKDDAEFVDVIHTNAFVQGTAQQVGHVDFYVNGGIVQPGCWAEQRFFACNHHRAPLYFAESINTRVGFWGWPCPSYLDYLLGRCLPSEPQIIMGEYADQTKYGVHLVITNSVSPFAVGKYTGPLIEVHRTKNSKFNINLFNK